MIKDEESLLRMNFLIQAARLYQTSFPEYSSHFLYDFVQISEKKIIRMYLTVLTQRQEAQEKNQQKNVYFQGQLKTSQPAPRPGGRGRDGRRGGEEKVKK